MRLVLLSSLNRMKNDISVMEARLAAELKDIKGTVEHSNSSVRTLQSTFAAEKLRKLSRDKAAAESPATKSGATQPGATTAAAVKAWCRSQVT